MDTIASPTRSQPLLASLRGAGPVAGRRRNPAIALALALFGVSLFAVRLAAPPRFLANEWRLSAYVIDVLDNGRWFSQTDTLGEIASKPPLLTWLSALAALPSGHVGPFALYWPTAAATIAIAYVLLATGRAHFGWRAGFLAAATYLASAVAIDQMRTARYDGVLALAVTAGALAAWRAWRSGRGWTWFWAAGAIGTLIKGPLAVILSATGLLSAFWDRQTAGPSRLRAHVPGVALYLVIAGGWLALAYLQTGPRLIEKIAQELVGHAIGGVGHVPPLRLSGAYKPVWTLLIDYAPWSLLAFIGAFRVVVRPSADGETRAFERFVLLWLAVGLLVFTLAAHHRARLIDPVVPAAALLAGRELERWVRRVPPAALLSAAAALGLAMLAVAAHPRLAGPDRAERATVAAGELARRLHALGPGEFPLTYADPGGPLQVWLGTRRVIAPVDQAVRLLAGPAPAFVVVESGSWADHALEGQAKEVFRWPASPHPQGRILSNYPRLEWPAQSAVILGGLRVGMERARLLRATDAEIAFRLEPGAVVSVVNEAPGDRTVRLRLTRPGGMDVLAVRRLAPGAAWRQEAPAS